MPFGDLEHSLKLVSARLRGRRSHALTACLHQKPLDFWTTDHEEVHVTCARISKAVRSVRGNEGYFTGCDLEKFCLAVGETHDFESSIQDKEHLNVGMVMKWYEGVGRE